MASVLLLEGCRSTAAPEDPHRVLKTPQRPAREYYSAMLMLDADPEDPAYLDLLKKMIFSPGYVPKARQAAFNRLLEHDPERLQLVLELNLPRCQMLQWRRMACELIAEAEWKQMTPTLIRAWAYPMPGWVDDDTERPERIALEKLHGTADLSRVLLEQMVQANPVTMSNLRARCWELLHSLGRRDILVALLQDQSIGPDDPMLIDMRKGLDRLGIIPINREEVLWLRALCAPENSEFFEELSIATATMSADRREQLELRDLPITVAAYRFQPERLTADRETLYRQLLNRRKGRGKLHMPDFQGYSGSFTETLQGARRELDWGDLVAMEMAMDAVDVPEVRAHVFDYADRDKLDRTCEYGGIIRLDDKGRFELVEYETAVKMGDLRYDSTQEMLDDAYTGLFHFHNHAQDFRNADYAGPHMGDFNYANNTRANCLVFTFINRNTINVDYYRHGRLVVDLGTISRDE